ETVLVGDRQEHAWVAHEVPRVDTDDPLGREDVVEGDRERPGIDVRAARLVVIRHVPPAQPSTQLLADRFAAVTVSAKRIRRQAICDCPCRAGDVADDSQGEGWGGSQRVAIEVDRYDGRVPTDERAVPHGPHVKRATPAD